MHNADLPLRGAIRDTLLVLCEAMARRCMEVRETLPVYQQLDVQYEDMNRDWQAVMRRVNNFVGLDFTAEAENAMGTWLADSEREGWHQGHRYSLEDLGLSREEVDTRMKFSGNVMASPMKTEQ